MQIAKWTGWTLDEIYRYDIKEINKLVVWAYNQEVAERENLFSVMQWHLGVQHKRSAYKAKSNITKNLKQKPYNGTEDKTSEWTDMFRAYAPNAFDKFIKSLKPRE